MDEATGWTERLYWMGAAVLLALLLGLFVPDVESDPTGCPCVPGRPQPKRAAHLVPA